jgi:streptogramin lyase
VRFTNVLILCLPLVLTGCSLNSTTATTPETSASGTAIHGIVHGGQQPIVGGHVYLYAAGTGGYGTASTSLLTSSVATNNPGYYGQDGSGNYYVVTNSSGSFSISSDYSCTSGAGVYLYSVGGDSGGGANSEIGLMAALGDCPGAGNFASATPFVMVNEVSTIAAAYAMAGFATDATDVSSSGTTLAQTGVRNALANAANLASISTGQALATTPASSGSNIGTVPQATINTLANILAACINSSGSSSTQCSTLFSNAKSAGSTGTTATDTATAAINMAHNPGANIHALYTLSAASPPFTSALGSQPNDFTIALNFTGYGLTGLSYPQAIAIDASGNAWVANYLGESVTKITSAGAGATGSPFTNGLIGPSAIAIDSTGKAWVANMDDVSVTKLNSAGAFSGNYSGGQLNGPDGIAIDGTNNAWIANYDGPPYYMTKLPSTGGATGYAGSSLNSPEGVAVDGNNIAWVANNGGNNISKLNGGVFNNAITGNGLNEPFGIAIDHSGNVWVANNTGSISKFSNNGSGLGSYIVGSNNTPYGIAIDGSGNVWVTTGGGDVYEFNSSGTVLSGANGYKGVTDSSGSIAIDGSGNVWVTNIETDNLNEFIGAATPVITPIAAGLPTTPSGNGTSNLGTRP